MLVQIFLLDVLKTLTNIRWSFYYTEHTLYVSKWCKSAKYGYALTNESLSGGLYFRNNFSNSDAILVVLGYESNGIRLGYSYDYTISELMAPRRCS